MVTDPERALQLLRGAVDADLFHGPAHNNIGVLLLERGQLYEAAEEFDWARRLMPGHPDPRINLGISLERGGRVDDALDAYASALEVYPEHLPSMQALVRLQVRVGIHDAQTRDLLYQIVQRGDASWRQWARTQIARLPEQTPAAINMHQ
jgi:tetratricopeptide (TPR) repeat protein